MTKINLIGKDLTYSKSKLVHEAIYNYLNLNFNFCNLEFSKENDCINFLEQSAESYKLISNVTFPYKQTVFNFATNKNYCLDESSKFAGGCNLIVSPTKTIFNFDGEGCYRFLSLICKNIKDMNILICGTGTTAKSIFYSLTKHNCSKIKVFSRKVMPQLQIDNSLIYKYVNDEKLLSSCDLLISAIPGDCWKKELFNLNLLNSKCLVMDVSYSSNETYLTQRAKNVELNAFDGKGMLVSQAVLSIQKICQQLKIKINNLVDYDKLYSVGIKAINS